MVLQKWEMEKELTTRTTSRISSPCIAGKVSVNDLNIRKGAGTTFARTGKYTGKGVFTIVETKDGPGSDSGWGKLKSGAGWIALDYAKRV